MEQKISFKIMSKYQLNLTKRLLILGFFLQLKLVSKASSLENINYSNQNKSQIFSPKMDYDEWTPLGRSDPLKNDPTFDYVPPVLDHVHYWLNSYTTETSTKRDILILEVTTKKLNSRNPNQFFELIGAPTLNNIKKNTFTDYFTGNSRVQLPTFFRTTNFYNNTVNFRNNDRTKSSNSFLNDYYNKKPRPYTFMLPPSIIFNQKNFSVDNNINNILNLKFNFTQIPSIVQNNTKKNKDSDFHKFQQLNNIQKINAQNSKNHLNHLLKLERTTVVPKIKTTKNYIPSKYSTQKHAIDPLLSFEKSNLTYKTKKNFSEAWPTSNNVSLELQFKKSDHLWNVKICNHETNTVVYNADNQLSSSSNNQVIIGQNVKINNDVENTKNPDIITGQQKNSNIYKDYFLLKQGILPENISLDVNKKKTLKVSDNSFSSLTNLSTKSFITTSELSKIQILASNSSTINNMNPKKTLQDTIPFVIPINYKKQIRNSIVIEKLNKSENHLNSTVSAVINKIDNSIPHFIENLTTASTLISTPTKTYSFQPLYFNEFITAHSSDLPLKLTKIFPEPINLTNLKSLNLTNIIYSPISINKFPTHTLLRQNTPFHREVINIPFNKLINKSKNINHIDQQISSNYQRFTDTSSTSISFSTLGIQSMQVESISKNYQDLFSKAVTLLPPISSILSTSPYSKLNNKYKMKIESIMPKIIRSDYKIKTVTYSPIVKMTTILPLRISTTTSSLTTDSIFSHYKQPNEPIQGPMYVIIQGHSKVKTYKPTVNKHEALIRID